MSSITYDALLKRISDGYSARYPIYGNVSTAPGSNLTGTVFNIQRGGHVPALPSLPSGVNSYIATQVSFVTSVTCRAAILAKFINMGSLDISSNVFTDGSAMPTETYLGTSRSRRSGVIYEVTNSAGLNATPGSLSITYVDQDGNTAEATTAAALPGSATLQTMSWIPLNSGDWGARDITTASRTGGTTPTGTLTFYGLIPLCLWNPMPSNVASDENLLTKSFAHYQLGASDQLGVILFANNTTGTAGEIFFIGDS